MSSEVAIGTTQGAIQGARAGSVFGPAGAAVGLVVGGAMGFAKGKAAKKAKKYARRATEIQQERESDQQKDTMLQQVRQARVARASSLAGSTYAGISTSSLSTSALSSIGSQSQYSMQYLANDTRLVKLYNNYMAKAGRATERAQAIGSVMQIASNLTAMGGSVASGISAGIEAGQTAAAANEQSVTNWQALTSDSGRAAFSSAYSRSLNRNLSTVNAFSF